MSSTHKKNTQRCQHNAQNGLIEVLQHRFLIEFHKGFLDFVENWDDFERNVIGSGSGWMIDDWMLLQKHLSSWLVNLLNIFRFCAANHSQMKKNFSSTRFLSGTFGAPTKIQLSTLLKHHLNVANHLQPHFSATFFVSLPSNGMKDLSPALDHPLESPSQSRMDLLSIGTSPAWVQKESCTWKRFTAENGKFSQGPSPFHKKGKLFLVEIHTQNHKLTWGVPLSGNAKKPTSSQGGRILLLEVHEIMRIFTPNFYSNIQSGLLKHPMIPETRPSTHWCLNFLLICRRWKSQTIWFWVHKNQSIWQAKLLGGQNPSRCAPRCFETDQK